MSAPTDYVRLQKGLENNSTARLVLFCISFYTNYQTGACWPSIATLASESNLHPTTVRRQVHELEKLGFIKLQPRDRASSIITLVGYREWMDKVPVRKAETPTSTELVGGTSGALEGTSGALEGTSGALEGTSGALAEIYNLNILNNINKKKPDRITDCNTDEDKRVFFHNEKLHLCDQLNELWLKLFDNQQDHLDLALLQITPYLQPNSSKPLEAQVSSQLSRIVRERKERDLRYQAGASKTHAPKKQTAREFLEQIKRGEVKL